MRRALVLLTTVVVAVGLAGCGEAVDTAKQTFPRSTVPAGQGGDENGGSATGKPKTNDPAFSNDKLRTLDPCGLLTDDILSALGKPADNSPEDFGNCANYMKDKDGKDLSITLYVGETINGAESADENIGGLPAMVSELDDHSACFVSVITSTNPNFGIRVQVGGDGDDLCGTGRTLLTSVVDLVREDPPQREEKKGSIAESDPCALLEPGALKTALGGVDTTISPYTLHWCNWIGDKITAGVWFRTGYDPKDSSVDAGQPVDLGNGLTVYQTAETSNGASCRLVWRHRSTGADGADEIIEVDLDNSEPAQGDNGCATATAIVQLLVPALPKP
ncbi:DUF3558 family protein [Actinophytocola oryzae]|uniref:Uncharacterized protein DUF3558 n=1 Tax=Actinophytocola oryzae TaxID=502181 RepID=A0A4R7VX01_9PSEU|nr:DUF3558 family protein [Actinophytocola oryzae]TDV54019.1 uncharacterized protein DUF3558 [Actinophytocola oryzae]